MVPRLDTNCRCLWVVWTAANRIHIVLELILPKFLFFEGQAELVPGVQSRSFLIYCGRALTLCCWHALSPLFVDFWKENASIFGFCGLGLLVHCGARAFPTLRHTRVWDWLLGLGCLFCRLAARMSGFFVLVLALALLAFFPFSVFRSPFDSTNTLSLCVHSVSVGIGASLSLFAFSFSATSQAASSQHLQQTQKQHRGNKPQPTAALHPLGPPCCCCCCCCCCLRPNPFRRVGSSKCSPKPAAALLLGSTKDKQ